MILSYCNQSCIIQIGLIRLGRSGSGKQEGKQAMNDNENKLKERAGGQLVQGWMKEQTNKQISIIFQ